VSDDYLRFIPTEPAFVPDPAAAEQARRRLAALVPNADEVTATYTDQVQFVDQGANFDRVSCPRCRTTLGIDWWHEAMDASFEAAFERLDVRVPCCGATLSLNDLDYDWPAGFARFVLEAMNPGVRDLPTPDAEELASILGAPFRRIWAHY
jgi:hypothetical protein